MDISTDVAAIVAQAPEWNFAGDCALLELMKRISQNLHEHGERTDRNLKEFERNVRRVDIGLDNATNSLRSLQFGQQFVEYRVEEEDDDDFLIPEEQRKKPEPVAKSSQEMAKEFLQNNLRMFRKNFEPVNIEVPDDTDDDDDDEGAVNITTVFCAKNPYDAIPLPYIIGSKQWQDHKYAGIYDSDENSEDEEPEQFSSSSADEIETATPKPTPRSQQQEMQQSDSSSLASLPTELPAPVAQPVVATSARSKDQPRPIKSSQRNPNESDLFAALRSSPPSDDPPSTSSSLSSSPAISHRHPAAHSLPRSNNSLSSSSSSASKPHLGGRHSPPNLFSATIAVAAASPAPTSNDVPITNDSDVKPVAAASQIKRKPVNIFNDDEFNSLMSDIVDKMQTKSGTNSAPAATVAQTKESPKGTPAPEHVKPVAPLQKMPRETPQRSVNLFDESPPLSPNLRQQTKVAVSSAKTMPTSLFDDNLDDVDDFLSSFTTQAKPQLQTPKNSLFDDDDDLEIDDIFAKKTPPSKVASKSIAKTSLFDDEDEDNDNDIFGSSSKSILQSAKQQQEQPSAPIIQRKSLFEDLGDDDLFGTPKSNKNLFASADKDPSKAEILEDKPPDDILAAIPKQNEAIVQQVKNIVEPKKQIVEDQTKKLETEQQITQTTKDLPDVVQTIKAVDTKSQMSLTKSDLFSDDFSYEVPIKSSSPKRTDEATETNEITKGTEDLFSDDISYEVPVKSSPTKRTDETTETHEITKPTEDLKVKEIIHSTQYEPKNKKEDQESKAAEEQQQSKTVVMDDLFENLMEDSPTPIDASTEEQLADEQQDPIISMVADVSNKKSKIEMEPPPTEDIAAAQQIMQNYSSLFSDEPPDDSEFFQSLGTSNIGSLSASKIFDSEQDFFEPNLPELPQSAKATPAAVTPVEQPNNDYRGMRLFSDVPPDDVDEDEGQGAVAASIDVESASASTKRIHTIFYDDFSETARAGANQQSFDEEPPADVVDKSAAVEASQLPKLTSPVKKLQMPNININVKALLPGGGGGRSAGALPKLSKEQTAPVPAAPAATQALKPSSSETDNILPCISKTRVRGPAHRRPSTRRARQENYAKTLLNEQTDKATSIDSLTTSSCANKTSKLSSFESNDNDEAAAAAPPMDTQSRTAKAKSASFLDSDSDDDDSLFSKAVVRKAAAAPVFRSASLLPTQPPENDLKSAARNANFLDNNEEHSSSSQLSPPAVAPTAFARQQKTVDDFKSVAKAVSFLDSDEDEPNSFLFNRQAAATPQAPLDQVKSSARASLGPPKSYVSFLDNNEEDEDDGFLFSPTKPLAVTQTVASQKPKEDERKVQKPSSMPTKLASSTLNSDDDSLFKPSPTKLLPDQVKAKPAPVTVHNQEPPELVVISNPRAIKPIDNKLFDDSDDDDDLFGSTSAAVPNTKSKEAPKSKTIKSKLPAKPSKSLFSDDDDDDDLFGSGGAAKAKTVGSQVKPVKSAPLNMAKKTPSKPKVTPSPVSTDDVSDNPLADLLGP